MKYKIGDEILIIKNHTDRDYVNKYRKGKGLKNEIGKIIENYDNDFFDVEIINCPYKKECQYFKNGNYCHTWFDHEIQSINSLKLKKLVKHGV